MAINAAETPVLNDCFHIKSCQSKSTQSSVISGLTSAFWPCFTCTGGVPGHPVTTALGGDTKRKQSSRNYSMPTATFPEGLYILTWGLPEQEQN